MLNSNDSILVKFNFIILVLYLNINLLIYFFVYTYYITFYTIVLDIYIICNYIYLYSIYNKNNKIKEYSFRVILFILIILLCVPLNTIIIFYV